MLTALGSIDDWPFFAWEAALGMMLMLDQLKRRGRKLPNSCYMCKGEEDTIDDILLLLFKIVILW